VASYGYFAVYMQYIYHGSVVSAPTSNPKYPSSECMHRDRLPRLVLLMAFITLPTKILRKQCYPVLLHPFKVIHSSPNNSTLYAGEEIIRPKNESNTFGLTYSSLSTIHQKNHLPHSTLHTYIYVIRVRF
jgi:hypothetical protein